MTTEGDRHQQQLEQAVSQVLLHLQSSRQKFDFPAFEPVPHRKLLPARFVPGWR